VESCTALVEHACGRLEILEWPKIAGARPPAASPELEQPLAA
jgi:hypothetical protein